MPFVWYNQHTKHELKKLVKVDINKLTEIPCAWIGTLSIVKDVSSSNNQDNTVLLKE